MVNITPFDGFISDVEKIPPSIPMTDDESGKNL